MICPAECEGSMDLEAAMNFRGKGFIVEEKLDGIRAVLSIFNEVSVTGRIIKHGRPSPLKRANALSGQSYHLELKGSVLDGELVSDNYHIFDVPIFRGMDLRSEPLSSRKKYLASIAEFLPANCRIVRSFNRVSEMGGFSEGLVWKRTDSKYGFGWWKAKRVETIDVIVSRVLDNGVAEVEGKGKVVNVPSAIRPGDTIEVEAFKTFTSGKLRNGRFVRMRDDK